MDFLYKNVNISMRKAIRDSRFAQVPGVAERLMRRSVKPFQVGSTPTPWTKFLLTQKYEYFVISNW